MSGTLKVLQALARDGAWRCCRDVAAVAGLSRRTVANRIQRLKARGFVEIGTRGRTAGFYRLTALGRRVVDTGVSDLARTKRGALTQAAPRRPKKKTARDRAWWHLRTNGRLTLTEILTLMDWGARNPTTVAVYLRDLWRAGYLEVARHRAPGTAPTSNGDIRWMLMKNTGPLAPVVQRGRGRVWDPNSKSFAAFERLGSPRAFIAGLRG